jgi:hypothetical protein
MSTSRRGVLWMPLRGDRGVVRGSDREVLVMAVSGREACGLFVVHGKVLEADEAMLVC